MGIITIHVAIEIESDDDGAADRAAALVEGMPALFQLAIEERAAQDKQFGGPDHDDGHIPADWYLHLRDHVGRLVTSPDHEIEPAPDYFSRLIKIIALGVAAGQSWMRLEHAKVQAALGKD